jgi:Tol biopolymer transport system component
VSVLIAVAHKPSQDDLSLRAAPFTTSLGSAFSPAFSPDGNSIAFALATEDDSTQSLYLKMIGSNTELKLTSPPGWDSFPSWSPDGRQIAFLRRFQDYRAIYVVSALGGPARELFRSRYGMGDGITWLRDGKHLIVSEGSAMISRIVFAEFDSPPVRLASVDLTTGIASPLTSPPANIIGDERPLISPDGKSIAFMRKVADGVEDVFLVPISGGEVRQLTNYRTQFGGISWMPGSQELLITFFHDGNAQLWRLRIASGQVKPVTASLELVSNPTAAPQGNRLAYIVSNDRTDLRRVALSASQPPTLLKIETVIASTRLQGDPTYSPDGRRLAFHCDRTGSVEIWESDADGSNLMQITNCGGSNNGSPKWSPDGSMIAFDSRSTGAPEIFVVSAQGSGLRQVTRQRAENVVPSWSRDGRWIYFTSNRSGNFQIWKLPAATGETALHPAVQITEHGGFGAYESADGKYLYFAKGRAVPGLWRKPLTGGIKAPEEPVLPSLQHWGWWTLGEKGIFFIERPEKPPGAKPRLKYLAFDSGQITKAGELDQPINPWHPALTLSPDGRNIVYEQPEQIASNIVLIENFK